METQTSILIAIVSVLASVVAILGFTVRSLFAIINNRDKVLTEHLIREEAVMQKISDSITQLAMSISGVGHEVKELRDDVQDVTPVQGVPTERSELYRVRRTPPKGSPK